MLIEILTIVGILLHIIPYRITNSVKGLCQLPFVKEGSSLWAGQRLASSPLPVLSLQFDYHDV